MDDLIQYVNIAHGDIGHKMTTSVKMLDRELRIKVVVIRRVGIFRQCWNVFRHTTVYCCLFQPAQVELDARYPGAGYSVRQFICDWAYVCRVAEGQLGIPIVLVISVYSRELNYLSYCTCDSFRR